MHRLSRVMTAFLGFRFRIWSRSHSPRCGTVGATLLRNLRKSYYLRQLCRPINKNKLGVCVGYRIVCHGAWPFPYKYPPTGIRLHWPLKPVDSSAEMSDGPESPFYFRENGLLLVRLQRRDALIKRANIISRIGLRVVDFATT
jgi:hypothetical protein